MSRNGVYFSIIPSGIMDHETLSDGAKLTYALILGLSNKYGYCYASNNDLTEMRITCSKSTVERHIKELLESGVIEAQYSKSNYRKLYCHIMPTDREKLTKNSKTVRYAEVSDDEHFILDQVYKSIKVNQKRK